MIEIKTERLSVRRFVLNDAAFILRLLNEPTFIEHIADKGVRDLDAARDYLRRGPMASYERYGFGLWHVGLLDNDEPIGMAGLLKRDYLEHVDIGYALLPEYCGAGYAFEMASAVMGYAGEVLDAKQVMAIVSEGNTPSMKLLGKLGFQPDGMIHVPGDDRRVRLFRTVA